MLKPHTVLLLSALLALCATVFLTAAEHEPKAALAAGYALLAGITSLALYLSSRQKASRPAKTADSAQTDGAVQHAPKLPVNVPNEPKANRYEPRYTSHSRA